jgi:antitoxin VapB
MPLSIKNAETEAIARRLAELTGESITEAIQKSLEERYARMQKKRDNAKLLADLQ